MAPAEIANMVAAQVGALQAEVSAIVERNTALEKEVAWLTKEPAAVEKIKAQVAGHLLGAAVALRRVGLQCPAEHAVERLITGRLTVSRAAVSMLSRTELLSRSRIETMAPYYLSDGMITPRNRDDIESIAQWGSALTGETQISLPSKNDIQPT